MSDHSIVVIVEATCISVSFSVTKKTTKTPKLIVSFHYSGVNVRNNNFLGSNMTLVNNSNTVTAARSEKEHFYILYKAKN